jgi:uncharacterized protein DUF2437
MKLITFTSAGAASAIGVLDGDEVVPLAADPAARQRDVRRQ